MDILENKYISPDELKQIAYAIPPKYIVSLCQTNTVLRDICRNTSFWLDYIDSDQNKYNALIIQLCKEGALKLFTKLWFSVPPTLFSEPQILRLAFETAFLNGHEEMAEYLYILHNSWNRILLEHIAKNIGPQNFDKYVDRVYDEWSALPRTISDPILLKEYENDKFKLVLRDAILRLDYKYAKKLIQEFNLNGFPAEILALSSSYKKLNKIISAYQDLNYDVDISNMEDVVKAALINSNFRLAKRILNEYPELDQISTLRLAFYSKSSKALKFIKAYISKRDIMNYSGEIMNRDVINYVLSVASERHQNTIIFNSFNVFKPYEYVNLIEEYMGCITARERDALVGNIFRSGKFYMAKVVISEIVICD